MMLWFSRKSAVSLLFCAVAASAPAAAQQSASYELSEHVFNAGGHPRDGQVASSANYQVSLDSIGDAFMARGLSSAGYSMDVGFVTTYPPPGEVLGLRFPADDSTLAWDAEPSVGNYDLYRSVLPAGHCRNDRKRCRSSGTREWVFLPRHGGKQDRRKGYERKSEQRSGTNRHGMPIGEAHE